jgi:hypothetical protein
MTGGQPAVVTVPESSFCRASNVGVAVGGATLRVDGDALSVAWVWVDLAVACLRAAAEELRPAGLVVTEESDHDSVEDAWRAAALRAVADLATRVGSGKLAAVRTFPGEMIRLSDRLSGRRRRWCRSR